MIIRNNCYGIEPSISFNVENYIRQHNFELSKEYNSIIWRLDNGLKLVHFDNTYNFFYKEDCILRVIGDYVAYINEFIVYADELDIKEYFNYKFSDTEMKKFLSDADKMMDVAKTYIEKYGLTGNDELDGKLTQLANFESPMTKTRKKDILPLK